MGKYIKQLIDLWSLIVGLFVTGDNLRKSTITVHYPRQEVDNLASFRGPLELLPKAEDAATPKCVSCMMCVSTCPSGCITVVKHKAPKPTPEEKQALAEAETRGEKVKKPKAPKNPKQFIYDYSYCSLCGLCSEVCPVQSLGFSSEAYMICSQRSDTKLDLLAKLKDKALARRGAEKEVA